MTALLNLFKPIRLPWPDFSRPSVLNLRFRRARPRRRHGIIDGGRPYLPVQLCHMPSSKSARLADFNRPLAVTITSVDVTKLRAASGGKLPPASTRAE